MSEITVVIPALNGSATIAAALASVASQSRAPDAVIVVDDGSSDSTVDVAMSFADLLPLTVLVQDQTRGVAAAVSRGVAHRAGAFARLDADDVWFPDHLATLEQLHRPNIILSADALLWWPCHRVSNRSWFDRYPLPAPPDQFRAVATRNIALSAVLMEISLFESLGGYADFDAIEDWDLWLRAAEQGVTFAAASHPTMLYRQSGRSRSKGATAARVTVAMLERFASSTHHPQLAEVARRTASDWNARANMFDAQDAARRGDGRRARRLAIGALSGSWRTRSRSIPTVIAPKLSTRLYDAVAVRL